MKNSNSHAVKTLGQLKKEILADGIIDANEVKELKAVLFADGIIDKEEAELLFELNDAVSGKENDPSWAELFVKAIGDHVLEDDNSPGVIDKTEANWLHSRIQGDGKIDPIEKKLLMYLRGKAKDFPVQLENLLN